MTKGTNIYMIPGTGTDGRIFTPQLAQFTEIITPAWLPPLEQKESLASYAKRLAATLDTSTPFILGGLSLGGMLAQEMASYLQPIAVILISTSSSYKSIPLVARLAGRATRALPNFWMKLQLSLTGKLVKKSHLRHKDIYARMLKEMPPELVRWQSGAATEWELKQPLSMPVFHIHGSKDKIIPIKNIKDAAIISGGGHLINVTHASQTNAFIQECLNRIDAPIVTRTV